MRSYRFSPAAEAALEQHIDYLLDRDAGQAARKLERRLRSFIEHTLSRFPFIGTHIPARGIYETWVPGTNSVLWYTVTDETVTIYDLAHGAGSRARGNE